MSAVGERVLMQSLFDPDNLDVLAKEGIALETVPTEDFHSIILFSLRYFHESGRRKAPNTAVFASTEVGLGKSMLSVFEDHEIPTDEDPEESVEWALEDLKATFVHRTASSFNKNFATAMAEAESSDREQVLGDFATKLVKASMTLDSKSVRVDIREGMDARMVAYEERAANTASHMGMAFGIPLIDNHTFGIHPGELAMFAAFAKFGKSYFVDRVAVKEFEAGRNVALFTLENSVDMTLDRIACMAVQVDANAWQRGECHDGQVALVRAWIKKMKEADNTVQVMQPEPGKRTPESMIRQAQILGCESVIIDQLSHIEHPDHNSRRPRPETVAEILANLKSLISTGRDKVSCLVAHQINREGKAEADSIGYHKMVHLAESSAAERACDHVFSGYQSYDAFVVNEALIQILAARRYGITQWHLEWDVNEGHCVARYVAGLGKKDEAKAKNDDD